MTWQELVIHVREEMKEQGPVFTDEELRKFVNDFHKGMTEDEL